MIKREIITSVGEDEEYTRPEKTNHHRRQYYDLLGRLGAHGTEVKRHVSHQKDPDINPFAFIVARHTFIFPPQPVELMPDIGDGFKGKGPRGEEKDNKIAEFDTEAVKGYLEVVYNDDVSRQILSLRVEDLMGDSDLPSEAVAVLESIFPPATPADAKTE